MTVDVEDYFHVAAFENAIDPSDWPNYETRVENNTETLLNLFEKKNLTATFFILGWVAERYPNLVKFIADSGHEIASHGYSHQIIYKQTQEVFKEEAIKSKQLLEDIIQKPVTGYRAASYSITPKSLWALDILADAGYEWDSSIFPIHHDKYGIPTSPTTPYYIKTSNGKLIKELPLTTAKFMGFKLPAAGGGYFRLFPYWLSRTLLKNASKNNPAIFYLHPWEVDPEQPRVEGASLLSRFRHYNNLEKCMHRLDNLTNDFQFTYVSDALSNFNGPTININELVA